MCRSSRRAWPYRRIFSNGSDTVDRYRPGRSLGRVVEQVLLRQDRLAGARAPDQQRDAVQRQPTVQHGVQPRRSRWTVDRSSDSGPLATQIGAGARAGHAPWTRTATDPPASAGTHPPPASSACIAGGERARPRGSGSRRAPASLLHNARPAPPEIIRSITTRSGGSSSRHLPGLRRVEHDPRRVPLGAQEVVREIRGVRVALGQQDHEPPVRFLRWWVIAGRVARGLRRGSAPAGRAHPGPRRAAGGRRPPSDPTRSAPG